MISGAYHSIQNVPFSDDKLHGTVHKYTYKHF